MVNETAVNLLCKALESDEFTQGQKFLYKNGAHCCLGVACVVAFRNGIIKMLPWHHGVNMFGYSNSSLPERVRVWYGFEDSNPLLLVRPYQYEDDDIVELLEEEGIEVQEEEEIYAIMANDELRWTFPEIAKALRTTYLGL